MPIDIDPAAGSGLPSDTHEVSAFLRRSAPPAADDNDPPTHFDADDSGAQQHTVAAEDDFPAPRTELERLIEEAIALLDGLDVDCDLEPSLAGSYSPHHAYDAEGDSADEELSGDENEPGLGALQGVDQRHWSFGGQNDLELDTSDFEPWLAGYWHGPVLDGEQDDADREPDLGSLDGQIDQENWSAGEDREATQTLDDIRMPPCPYETIEQEAAACRAASQRLREIVARLKRRDSGNEQNRPSTSICNVGPLVSVMKIEAEHQSGETRTGETAHKSLTVDPA